MEIKRVDPRLYTQMHTTEQNQNKKLEKLVKQATYKDA